MLNDYGWSAKRIFSGYAQFVSAVRGIKPKSLDNPGADDLNVAKQCFEYVCEFPTYDDQLLRAVLGGSSELSKEDWLAFHYFEIEFSQHLKENPWEPDLRLEPLYPVEFVKLSIAAIATATDERTLQRWVKQGMPHQKDGRKIFLQLSVVERWQKMKYRHKYRKGLTRRAS